MSGEFSIVLSDGTALVPSEEPTPNQEMDKIVQEHIVANIVGEIAYFRIWRLRKNGQWKEIEDDKGNNLYLTWEEFVQDIGRKMHVGRQSIFDRVRVYEQLNWLGYTAEECIRMLSEQSSLYTRVLNMVVDWDQRNEKPKRISIPEVDQVGEEEAKDYLRDLLHNVSTSFDTQREALQYVSETILVEPQVDMWFNGDTIKCSFFVQSIDEQGNIITDEYGEVTFYPDDTLPDWVVNKIEELFRSVGRYDKNNQRSKTATT